MKDKAGKQLPADPKKLETLCQEYLQRCRESEAKLKAIFEGARDGIVLVDAKTGDIIDCNPEFEKQTGRSINQLTKLKIWQTRPLKQQAAAHKKFIDIRQKGKGGSAEFELQQPSGDITYIDFLSKAIEYNGRKYLLSISRDITGRKRVEEALLNSEEKYRSLFDNMIEGFAYCRVVVDKNNRPVDFIYLVMNKAFERLTGYNKKDFIDKRITEVIPGIRDSKTDFIDIYGRVALTGKVAKFEAFFEPLRKWLRIYAYSPKKGYFVAVFDDITKRKQAEDKLKQDERKIRELATAYVQAHEEESQWISLEIHDRIVQPLFTVIQQIEQLKSQMSDNPIFSEALGGCLNLIQAISQETRNVTHDFYPATLTRYGLVRLMNYELTKLEDETGCQIRLSVEKNLRIGHDITTTFYRVFHEALLNIRKHADASRVMISLKRRKGTIELKIEDDGVGFDVAHKEEKVPGGLESMRRRTEIVGGSFKLMSVPGAGTNLVCCLPVPSKIEKQDAKSVGRKP